MAFNGGLFNTIPFGIVLFILLFFTGLWIPLACCILAALAVAFLSRYFVFGKRVRPTGKSALLVTGCSTGIGHDAALHLARSGYIVFATVRKEEHGKELVSQLDGKEGAGKIVPVLMDVTKEEQIRDAAETVAKTLEAEGAYLHGIVNNAGYAEGSFLELMPINSLRYQFEVNVFGLVAVTQAFLPLLRKAPKGNVTRRIVNISSVVGKLTSPLTGAYCGTKFAVEAISDSMRQELSLWDIEVVTVEPGAIASQFSATLVKTIGSNMDEASRQAEARVGTEVYEKYQKWTASTSKQLPNVPHWSTKWTSAAIESALFEKSPLVRYLAGPDAQIVPFATKIPDPIKDLAFSIVRRFAGV